MHQGYSLFHQKPSPKFEIEALFRLVMLYTDTKKKKYIIVKSIHSSFRSESKSDRWIQTRWTLYTIAVLYKVPTSISCQLFVSSVVEYEWFHKIRTNEYKIREKAISNLSKCIINSLIINKSDSQENCLADRSFKSLSQCAPGNKTNIIYKQHQKLQHSCYFLQRLFDGWLRGRTGVICGSSIDEHEFNNLFSWSINNSKKSKFCDKKQGELGMLRPLLPAVNVLSLRESKTNTRLRRNFQLRVLKLNSAFVHEHRPGYILYIKISATNSASEPRAMLKNSVATVAAVGIEEVLQRL
ncbi:hypothetical protein AGLY_009865 [Aphis glycines]|uniref:Uncharacterized protein n=1 Tax=Aphis glycines TaxID=307491 RepID=A0A6G0TH25_APHGL|nr:hypothetical protein AGLY_009865 [Aphis glycines]